MKTSGVSLPRSTGLTPGSQALESSDTLAPLWHVYRIVESRRLPRNRGGTSQLGKPRRGKPDQMKKTVVQLMNHSCAHGHADMPVNAYL